MKAQIIKLLREHLGKREEPEIKALLKGLDEMSEEVVKGIAKIVLDAETIIQAFKLKYDLNHAYDKKN